MAKSNETPNQETVMNDKVFLDPRDLATRLEDGDVVLIDTRDPRSFEAGQGWPRL